MFLRASLTLALAWAASCTPEPAGSHVLVLDDSNFDATVKEHDIMLVEFYAPWCGACKALLPHFTAAAAQLKGQVALGKLDCTANSGAAQAHAIRSYPTLKVFYQGTVSDFKAARSTPGIVEAMTAFKASPTRGEPAPPADGTYIRSKDSHVLELSAGNFDATIGAFDLAMVVFYAPWCAHCKHILPHLDAAAATLKPMGVAIATVDAVDEQNKPLSERFGVTSYPTIKVWEKKNFVAYDGARYGDYIVAFMKAKKAGRPPPAKHSLILEDKREEEKKTLGDMTAAERTAYFMKLSEERKSKAAAGKRQDKKEL